MDICPVCGSAMEITNIPIIKWEMKLWKYELQLWDFNHKEYFCIVCAQEEAEEPYRREYEAGHQDGFMEAMNKYEPMR